MVNPGPSHTKRDLELKQWSPRCQGDDQQSVALLSQRPGQILQAETEATVQGQQPFRWG